MAELLYNTCASFNHGVMHTHVEFPFYSHFTLPDLPPCRSGSLLWYLFILCTSKCKALLKTPSPRRACASVDSGFHNHNQKGTVCLILRLSHSAAPSSLHRSQRLMRTFFSMDDTLWSHYCVIMLFKMHDRLEQQCVSASHCR